MADRSHFCDARAVDMGYCVERVLKVFRDSISRYVISRRQILRPVFETSIKSRDNVKVGSASIQQMRAKVRSPGGRAEWWLITLGCSDDQFAMSQVMAYEIFQRSMRLADRVEFGPVTDPLPLLFDGKGGKGCCGVRRSFLRLSAVVLNQKITP